MTGRNGRGGEVEKVNLAAVNKNVFDELATALRMPRELGSQVARRSGDDDAAAIGHGFSPVISLSSLKKPRLRSLLMLQLTGTL